MDNSPLNIKSTLSREKYPRHSIEQKYAERESTEGKQSQMPRDLRNRHSAEFLMNSPRNQQKSDCCNNNYPAERIENI